MPAKNHAALILAAGFSTRMRMGFKPLLPISFADGERNALACVAQLYAEAGVQRVFVVGGSRRGADILSEAKRLGLTYVHNPHAERGMFSSIRTGLEALGGSGKGCFVHPVDIPLVRLCTVHALLEGTEEYPGEILVPVFKDEEGHPPLLPAAIFSDIRAWRGENGLRGALRCLPRRRVSVADKNILLDMDTDDGYAEVCRRAGRYPALDPDEEEEASRCPAGGVRAQAMNPRLRREAGTAPRERAPGALGKT